MSQQMRVDAPGLEARLVCEAPEDEERSGPRQGTALCVQEELGPMAPVEKRDGHGSDSGEAPRLRCVLGARSAPCRPCRSSARVAHPGRRRHAPVPRPRSPEGLRRREARRGRGREGHAASCPKLPRPGARPRPERACAAAGGHVWEAPRRRPGSPPQRRSGLDDGRTRASRPAAGRSSRRPVLRRAARRGSARAPRASPSPANAAAMWPGLSDRADKPRPSAAPAWQRKPRETTRLQDLGWALS